MAGRENSSRGGSRSGGSHGSGRSGGYRGGSGRGSSRSGGTGRGSSSRGAGTGRGGSSRDGGKKWSDHKRDDHTGGAQRNGYRGRSQGGRNNSRPDRRRDDTRADRRFPPVPDDVQMSELDKGARVELKTLTKENADWVAGHLVMASRLIETNPELAHEHALAAKARAARVAVVRETLGITAYETGDYALALRELRTFRRISGSEEQLALMVECERGLGRLDAALELAQSVDPSILSTDAQVTLAVAKSGVRLDLGQAALALEELQISQLNPDVAFSYSPMLFHAYATVLEDLGRADEASEWMRRADVAESVLYGEDADDDSDGGVSVTVVE